MTADYVGRAGVRALAAILVLWSYAVYGLRWAVTAWVCYLLGTWLRLVVLPDLRTTWVISRAVRRHPSGVTRWRWARLRSWLP